MSTSSTEVTASSADDVLAHLAVARVVPVVVVDDAAAAPDLVAALVAGGLRCAEITLRTEAGLAAIAAAVGSAAGTGTGSFLVGAGTVLTPRDVDAVVDAGASFVVSPGLDEAVVRRAQERGVLALPGIATATELQAARRMGLDTVKIFPAEQLGGLATVSALASAFPSTRFMPSGGVGRHNAAAYLAHPAVLAVGGSWMVPRAAVAARDVETITRLSADASSLVDP